MFKRIVSFFLIVVISWTSIAFAETENKEEVEVYNKGIYFNGEKLINSYSVYPFFEYRNIVYMPLTVEISKIAGFEIIWDEEAKTISIVPNDPVLNNYEEQWIKHEWKTIGVTPSATRINIFEKKYESEAYPIFNFNYISYIPLTYSTINDFLGWDMYYNQYTGIYISSIEGQSARSTFDEESFSYYKTLAEYAMNINKNLSESEALDVITLMANKSKLYEMDEILVFSVMWQESNFNPSCYYKGAIGLMQIMDSTGKTYDLTPQMLYDPEINVDFGVRYLKDKIDMYDGSVKLGLTAYNQGVTRVNKGNYSLGYYEDVMNKKAKLGAYLKEQGVLVTEDSEQETD